VGQECAIRYIARRPQSAQQWSSKALSVTIDSVLVQNKELTAASVDGRIVVLSASAGAYFDFNTVATEIWGMLTEPCSVSRIFYCLSKQHNIDAETLVRDVTPFLQNLVEQRLATLVTENLPP
jgi:Coenzyme PQQ synthesis protein D (PqqD)